MPTNNCRLVLAVSAAACWLAAVPAHADMVAEWDFRTDQNLSYAIPGASTASSLTGIATVNTGPTSLTGQHPDDIKFGALQVPNTSTSGLVSTDQFTDYFGTGTGTSFYESGAILVVFKPDFNYAATDAQAVKSLLYSGAGATTPGLIWLYNNDDSDGPSVRWAQYEPNGGGGWNNIVRSASIYDYSWNSNTWYALAVSWREGSVMQLFARPITAGSVTTYANSGVLMQDNAGAPVTLESVFYIGRYSGTGVQGDGSYSLVRFYDSEYWSLADFNYVYSMLLPEPASLVLLCTGISTALLRRRTRHAP